MPQEEEDQRERGEVRAGVGPRSGPGAAAPGIPAVPAGSAPVRRFVKELIRVGTWVHPTKGFTLEVTPRRMQGWLEAFRRMKEAGLKVPLPFGHSYDPRDNAGFLEDLRLEGNRLVGVLAVARPEDARRIGTTIRDVSICINPDFIDAKGNRYGEVIEHVALTNYPIVEGQADFHPVERVAAGADEEAEVWTFTARRLEGPEHTHTPAPGEEGRGPGEAPSAPAQAEPADLPPSGEEPRNRPSRDAAEEDQADGPPPVEQEGADETEPTGEEPDRLPDEPEADAGSPAEPTSGGTEGIADGDLAREGASAAEADDDSFGADAGQAQVAALRLELARERSARIEAEVARHVAAGRIPPAAGEVARVLLDAGTARRFDLDRRGEVDLDIAATFRRFLALLPEGGAVDLSERTRHLRPMPNSGNARLAAARATAAAARRMLESRGYSVTLSPDGSTILEAVKNPR